MNEGISVPAKIAHLRGVSKAALFIMALGAKAAASIFQYMNEIEVEMVTRELVNTQDVPGEMLAEVLQEYLQMIQSQQYITQGGIEYARSILEEALDPSVAHEIINRVKNPMEVKGFNLLQTLDPGHLLNVIQNEHPQTIALVLAHINPTHAASILSQLSPQLQTEVPYRMAVMKRVSPEAMHQVERVLEAQVASAVGGREVRKAGGLKMVAEVINLVDRTAEKRIMEDMAQRDAELAMNIKNLMFVFEDILLLDDRSVVRVLREVQTKDLSLALKAASEEVKAKIFRNVSQRVSAMIKEEMEFMGPVRLREVEEAQQRIAETIRSLEEAEEIVISGRDGDGNDVLV